MAQRISISVVFPMPLFLVVHKSHVVAMEHGVLRILCVNAALDMRIGEQSVLVGCMYFFESWLDKVHVVCHISTLLFSFSITVHSACPAGKYRSDNDTTCQQCPDNTVMDQEAAPECECLNGYFRNDKNRVTDPKAVSYPKPPNETPATACTSKSIQCESIRKYIPMH